MTTTSKCMSFAPNQTGGEYEHQLTVQELPEHKHYEKLMAKGYSGWEKLTIKRHGLIFDYNSVNYSYPDTTINAIEVEAYTNTSPTGGSASHNNIQPYITTFFWKRTI